LAAQRVQVLLPGEQKTTAFAAGQVVDRDQGAGDVLLCRSQERRSDGLALGLQRGGFGQAAYHLVGIPVSFVAGSPDQGALQGFTGALERIERVTG
jgi:hypothetical protein